MNNRDSKGKFTKGNTVNLGLVQDKETVRKRALTFKMRGIKIQASFKGRKHLMETIEKMRKAKSGENHPNWKGGITSESAKLRNNAKMKAWRHAIYVRDGSKCVICGDNERICADHIKSFRDFPELRYDRNNGRTLCYSCHLSTTTFGGRARRPKQVDKLSLAVIN